MAPTIRRGNTVSAQRGFTYLALLIGIAVMSLGLTAAAEVWTTVARRWQAEQLDWVGRQHVQAIGTYYEASPGGIKAYPKRLGDLLEDRRVPHLRRHLRQLYVNPFAGSADWELITAEDGGIRGVRGLSVSRDGTGKMREFVYSPAVR